MQSSPRSPALRCPCSQAQTAQSNSNEKLRFLTVPTFLLLFEAFLPNRLRGPKTYSRIKNWEKLINRNEQAVTEMRDDNKKFMRQYQQQHLKIRDTLAKV